MRHFVIVPTAKAANMTDYSSRFMDAYLPERLALTGATGALGFAFLRHNFERNPKLKATLVVRKTSNAFQADVFQTWLKENQERVTLVDGDIRKLEDKQYDALKACDGGIWHFAAITSLTAEDQTIAQEIREVNFEATERLIEAWQKGDARGPFYHVSTAYIVGERHGTALESESAMGQKFRNFYEASKLAAETCVLRAFEGGMPGTIFRPSVVVDNEGRTGGLKLADACAYAVALAVKRGEQFVFGLRESANLNMVHADWVIKAMTDLARMPSGTGKTYHISAQQDTYFRDIARLLELLVPGLKVSFEPGLKRSQLPSASKIFAKAVTEIRPYFDADIHFDRSNTDRDLSSNVEEMTLNLADFVKGRLETELGRIAHKK